MDIYKRMIDDLFVSVSQVVGLHVLLIVLERAQWKTKLRYEEAAMIRILEDGISLEELYTIELDRAALISREFMMNIVNTLGHLVGKQLAQQLTEQLEVVL